MHTTLTVWENLLFSARFRLPARSTRQQHLLMVERAIAVLQVGGPQRGLGVQGHACHGAAVGRRVPAAKHPLISTQLEDVRDSLIGDEETRGIRCGGGQRQRALAASRLRAVHTLYVCCHVHTHK